MPCQNFHFLFIVFLKKRKLFKEGGEAPRDGIRNKFTRENGMDMGLNIIMLRAWDLKSIPRIRPFLRTLVKRYEVKQE